jgi:hypothetical protein
MNLQWSSVTPKKHRHVWQLELRRIEHLERAYPHDCFYNGCGGMLARRCNLCGAPMEPDTIRRGRNNRSRGNAIEREIARKLGLKRVGMYGGPDDIGSASQPFIGQVKSGKSFPERLYRWLKALPSNANQTPILVMTDAPGPGIRRRALVIVTLEDWIALHGPIGAEQP